MSPGFAILFAAVIVLGVVGGQVMQTVMKELLPLLRTLIQERQSRLSAPPTQELLDELQSISVRMNQIEEDHERLSESNMFLQRLVDERLQPPSLPSSPTTGDHSRSHSVSS